MKTIVSIFLLLFYTIPLQAQQYKDLSAHIWLSLNEEPPGWVFIEDKNSKEKVKLGEGCYAQTSYSIDGAVVVLKFCITIEQIINGIYSMTDKDKKFETRIHIQNSLPNKTELYLSGLLAETVLSSYKDSIMMIKNYSDKMELIGERQNYFTAKDSGKSIEKKYGFNGKLNYINNEITGRLEEFDENEKLIKLTETKLKDSNAITTFFHKNGKKAKVIEGTQEWGAAYEALYDINKTLVFKKTINQQKETTENYENGELINREQWFLNESKSIVENFNKGSLISKEIIQNRYSLTSETTAYYNTNDQLIKIEKLREKESIVYRDTYNAKGKLVKTEKYSAITADGSKEPTKELPPQIIKQEK